MKIVPPFLAVPLLFLTVHASLANEVAGQIFIVTRGHQSIKLGLVAVAAFDAAETQNAIEGVKEKTKPEIARLQELLPKLKEFSMATYHAEDVTRDAFIHSNSPLQLHEAARDLREKAVQLAWDAGQYMTYLKSASRFFKELPIPLATGKTDADGNFTINIPGDREVLIGAAATREVFDHTESYHWLVVPPKDSASRIILSNDNLISPTGAESVLAAGDEDGRDAGSVDTLGTRLNTIIRNATDRLAKIKLTPAQRALVDKSLKGKQ